MIINNVVDGGKAFRVPAHLSLGQHVIDCLRENSQSDSVALVNGDTGEETSFSQILQGTVDVAVGLQNVGLKKGDTVALFGENMIKYLTAALGAICCGATITPINPMYPKDEVVHALNLSRPRFVFASRATLKIHLNTLKTYPSIETIIQLDGVTPVAMDGRVVVFSRVAVPGGDVRTYEPVLVQGHTDPAFILYSSGTTGLPKGVMLTHVNYLYSVMLFESQNLPKNILCIVPWYHAYGLMTVVNLLVLKKVVVFFSGVFNPPKYLQTIQDYKIGVLVTVPPIVVFLAKAPLVEQYDLSSVQMVWCGAAPLSSDTIEAAMKRMPECMGIFQGYGMTETSLVVTKATPGKDTMSKPGSCGYPIPGVQVKVVDIETRRKLGPNKNGELCIRGPIVMKGYINNDAATQEIMDEEGYLKTGDIGYYDPDGCFFLVDRLREFIKYKGNQVAPAAVESVILQHSGVAECGVVGRPDDAAGELPTAFVVPKPGDHITEKDLLDFTASRVVDIITREKLGPNEHGEICLKGRTMMKGYVDNELATREMFDDEGFMKTGDLGCYDNDGCFYIVDRFKEIIKYKGQQVSPAVVESVIMEHDAVAECGVVGAPDEVAGELPTAFVVRKPGASLTERDLLDYTASRLSSVSRLRGGIIFVEEIPRNGSGKILRRELRNKLLQINTHH